MTIDGSVVFNGFCKAMHGLGVILETIMMLALGFIIAAFIFISGLTIGIQLGQPPEGQQSDKPLKREQNSKGLLIPFEEKDLSLSSPMND